MLRIFMAVLVTLAAASAAEAATKKKTSKMPAGASFLGAPGGGGPRIAASFKGDADKARFKSAAAFYKNVEAGRD